MHLPMIDAITRFGVSSVINPLEGKYFKIISVSTSNVLVALCDLRRKKAWMPIWLSRNGEIARNAISPWYRMNAKQLINAMVSHGDARNAKSLSISLAGIHTNAEKRNARHAGRYIQVIIIDALSKSSKTKRLARR